MVKVIHTNLSLDNEGTIRDHQSLTYEVESWGEFIEGVKESFSMITNLFPTFIAMILAVNLFINSGVLDFILSIFKP